MLVTMLMAMLVLTVAFAIIHLSTLTGLGRSFASLCCLLSAIKSTSNARAHRQLAFRYHDLRSMQIGVRSSVLIDMLIAKETGDAQKIKMLRIRWNGASVC